MSEADLSINITVFERNPYIGGRSTTVNAHDDPSQPVELGASIFVSVNRNLASACEAFNLSTSSNARGPHSNTEPGETLGVWNGREFVFTQRLEENRWGSWWSTTKLLWRYGWAPVRTVKLMKKVVGQFLMMYEEPHFPWISLSEVVNDVGLTGVTASTGEQYLAQNGIGELFAKEIVQASTRVNYAQNLPSIHGLEAMVCMATDGAMAVEGGNWRIFEEMLKAADADVRLNTAVTDVRLGSDGSYTVSSKSPPSTSEALPLDEMYDTVILAAPYQFTSINFEPAPPRIPDEIPYVELHVTLLSSPHLLSPTFFSLPPNAAVPQVILTTLQPGERPGLGPHGVGVAGFFSLSTLGIAKNPHTDPPRDEYLYKIFSPDPVSPSFLRNIFNLDDPSEPGHGGRDSAEDLDGEINQDDVSWIYRKMWRSYPYLYPRATFEEVRLDENLWYTSGIESFISTMETSSLSGMNVARLVAERWIRAVD